MPPETPRVEGDLVARLQSGDITALWAFVHDQSPTLGEIALSVTGTFAAAEEVLQDVFLRVWEHRGALAHVRDVPAYLVRLTQTRAHDATHTVTHTVPDVSTVDVLPALELSPSTELASIDPARVADAVVERVRRWTTEVPVHRLGRPPHPNAILRPSPLAVFWQWLLPRRSRP